MAMGGNMMLTRTFFNRSPMTDAPLAPLPAGAIHALGSMQDRLLELRAGLLERSSTLYPELTQDSAWFGGSSPCTAEGALWLEAQLLTASLLSDDELRRRALRLAETVVEQQAEDGSFGDHTASFAARGKMLRALFAAYSITGEKRYLTFLLRYFKFLQAQLRDEALQEEDFLHLSDTLQAGIDLYNITGQRALLSVLMQLCSRSSDFTSLFHSFPYRLPISRQFSEEELRAQVPPDSYIARLLQTADGETLCEALRTVALCGILTGSAKQLGAAERGFAQLFRLHGAVSGGLTADPLLAGTHPSRGVSIRSIAELSCSLEALFACPEGMHLADAWERLVYNAAMAALGPDGRSVQAVQQSNQIRIDRRSRFPLSGDGASLFSLQDPVSLFAFLPLLPRFLSRQWMLSRDEGLCAMGYADCRVRYQLAGANVHLDVRSDYPRGGNIRIQIHLDREAAFPIRLRMPEWSQRPCVAVGGEIISGKPGTFLVLNREWHDGDELLLTLPMQPHLEETYHHAICVRRGPLLFAYQPEFTRDEDPQGDTAYAAQGRFAYAVLNEDIEVTEETEDTPLSLSLNAVPIDFWKEVDGSCDQPPIDLPDADDLTPVRLTLVPYARTVIRIAVFPRLPQRS